MAGSYTVSQSGSSLTIESSALGFTPNPANQANRYYINNNGANLSSPTIVITFTNGSSIKLDDFSQFSYRSNDGNGGEFNVIGIPSTPQSGFTNSVNIIGGFGGLGTWDVWDNNSNVLLIDNYKPQPQIPPGGGYRNPYALIGFDSNQSLLTIQTARQDTPSDNRYSARIRDDGSVNLPNRSPSSPYVGGTSGTSPGTQLVQQGSSSTPWIFSLTSPTPPAPTNPICFVAGTQILNGNCEYQAIETLRIGDEIFTSDGNHKVRWIAKRFYPHPTLELFPQIRPVAIDAHAFGHGLPSAKLLLSEKHVIIFSGFIIGAGQLENGLNIRRCSPSEFPEGVTYYHIELNKQEEIVANGLLVESYAFANNRDEFDNAAEYIELYGDINSPCPSKGYPSTPKRLFQKIYKTAVLNCINSNQQVISGLKREDFPARTPMPLLS